MYSRIKWFAVVFILVVVGAALAQEQGLPVPVSSELPLVMETLIGVVSAFLIEFVQKRQSPMKSLLLAGLITGTLGAISAFFVVKPSNLPVFLATCFAMSSTTWAVVFKGMGLKKVLGS